MTQFINDNESNEIVTEGNSSVIPPVGINLDQTKQRSLQTRIEQVQISRTNSPLPDPAILESYQALGYGDEVVDLIRKQQEHRQKMEAQAQQHSCQMDRELVDNYINDTKLEHEDKKRGQRHALTVTLTAIIGGCIVAVSGYGWPGGVISATGMMGLAST